MPVRVSKKVVAQLDIPATSSTAVYTVPKSINFLSSLIVVCNRSASTKSFRLSVGKAGEGLAVKQYLFYGINVPKESSYMIGDEICMQENDVLRVWASAADLSISVFGIEQGNG